MSREDDKLDETIDETFPASDAPANTVETGVRPGDVVSAVVDNHAASRFELAVDGHTAFLAYARTADTLTLIHTEVPESLRGRRLGDALAAFALDAGRAANLRIVVQCPFVRAYLQRHRQA